MTGKHNPEYSDLAAEVSIEGTQRIGRRQLRLQLEMGRHSLAFDGNFVLPEAETSYKELERELHESIIDQDSAIDAIIEAMDRSRVRLNDNPRPIATMAFLGPTGVGKSETARVLAEHLGTSGKNLVKIDCSNFSHGHEVASLIGSPPGYVSRDQAPFLSKKRVEKYGTVVLFDEIEKGSEELYDLMLQILGDGQLRLNDGSVTSFRNSVIILTSNLGAKEMSDALSKTPVGFAGIREEPSGEMVDKRARKAFEDFFKPEFVNRLDSTIVFNPLSEEGLGRVLAIKVDEANREYAYRLGMEVDLTDGAKDFLVAKALDERSRGARPLVRAFEKDIQGSFGKYVGSGQLQQGSVLQVFHHSEVPAEVQRVMAGQELVFTHHFDEDLWTRREEHKAWLIEQKRLREEAERKAEEEREAQNVVFVEPDDQSPPDSTPGN